MVASYPVTFDVDYPARPLDRLTTAFRIFVAIPIVIVLSLLGTETLDANNKAMTDMTIGGGLVFLPLVLMIVFRQKYPRWWFDWNLNLSRFLNRVSAYLFLLDDHYPSTDEEQAVHLEFPYPDARQLNRWLPLVKWLLAIPHYIVLFFLAIGAVVAVIVAWFAILFTGRYPRGFFDFVVGGIAWRSVGPGSAVVPVPAGYPPF